MSVYSWGKCSQKAVLKMVFANATPSKKSEDNSLKFDIKAKVKVTYALVHTSLESKFSNQICDSSTLTVSVLEKDESQRETCPFLGLQARHTQCVHKAPSLTVAAGCPLADHHQPQVRFKEHISCRMMSKKTVHSF